MKIKFAKDANGIKFYPITIAAGVVDNVRNQRLNVTLADLYANKASETGIVSCTTATLPATLEVNKYYNITDSVSSMTLALPTITDNTKLSVIAVYFSTGSSTPTVTISSAASATISYFSGYSIEASKSYELNIMWNGTKWIVAYATIE